MNLNRTDSKIAVFGSSGMVGSSIVRALKRSGYKNLLTPKRKDLNLLNYADLQKWFDKFEPEYVIIAAAKVGGIYANNAYPADFILENLKIQTNIIEISWKKSIKKLLFLGSSCIYPKTANQPITEEDLLSGFLEPTNQWYAIAKISGIKLCEALCRQYKFNAISLMPTNLYGPGDTYHDLNSHVIPSLIRRFVEAKINNKDFVTCWGTGIPKREFLHVDDLADACIFSLEKWDLNKSNSPKDKNGNLLYFLNVGTGIDISIKDLAILISQIIEFKGEIKWDVSKPDGTQKKLLNVSKINQLGWKSKINFKNGLEKTIDSYIKNII